MSEDFVVSFVVLLFLKVFVVLCHGGPNSGMCGFFVAATSSTCSGCTPCSFGAIETGTGSLKRSFAAERCVSRVIVFTKFTNIITCLCFCGVLLYVLCTMLTVSIVPCLTCLEYREVCSSFVFSRVSACAAGMVVSFGAARDFIGSLSNIESSNVVSSPILNSLEGVVSVSCRGNAVSSSVSCFGGGCPCCVMGGVRRLFFRVAGSNTESTKRDLSGVTVSVSTLISKMCESRVSEGRFRSGFVGFNLTLFFLVLTIRCVCNSSECVSLLSL